jgi:hypothetical protein
MALYIDIDQSNTWNAGDLGLKSDGTTYTYGAGGEQTTDISAAPWQAAINSYASQSWNSLLTMNADVQNKFQVLWAVPASAGNEIQGGSVSINFTFTIVQ